MKVLTQYYKNGYDFSLVKREGNLAIAKGKSRTGSHINWEVIEIQSHTGLQMGGNWVPASEFCPSTTQWGVKGWTGVNEQDAERIYQKQKCALQNKATTSSSTEQDVSFTDPSLEDSTDVICLLPDEN